MPLSPQEEFELLSLEREKSLTPAVTAAPVPSQPEFGANTDTFKALMQYTPVGIGYKLNEKLNQALDQAAYSAGGAVTDVTGSPAAGTAANVAVKTLPAMLPGGAVAKGAAGMMENSAKTWMLRALNPTPADMLSGKGQRAAQTMLERNLNPTNEGVATLNARGSDLNKQVDTLLSQSTGTVNKGAAASPIADVVSQIEKTNPIPQEARATVEKVYDQFLSNVLVPKEMSLQQAQNMKQGIYRLLKDQYQQPGVDPSKVSAMKALGMGLKQRIEEIVPGVAPVNKEASDIWNALNVAERRALFDAKKDLVGLALLPHNAPAMLALWANRSTAFKSALAKILYKGQEQIPATAARAGIGAYEVGTQQQP